MMKKLRLFTFLLLIFVFQTSFVFAQSGKKAEIKRINAYVKTVDAFVKKQTRPHLIFADTSDYAENSRPKWARFKSEATLEKFREESETYTIAYNWRKKGRIIQSNFTLSSPSGDWAQYDFYYFRSNGKLAKISSELRTFYGDLIILRDLYFDQKGKLLRQTVRYRDLNTNKPVKNPEGEFFENEVTVYKTTGKLPFARLLKRK